MVIFKYCMWCALVLNITLYAIPKFDNKQKIAMYNVLRQIKSSDCLAFYDIVSKAHMREYRIYDSSLDILIQHKLLTKMKELTNVSTKRLILAVTQQVSDYQGIPSIVLINPRRYDFDKNKKQKKEDK